MLYIHIPYCHQKCTYCAFYSLPTRQSRQPYIDALCLELASRRSEQHHPIRTIYFGGGTPSILAIDQLQQIITTLQRHYDTSALQEATLEANPEDLTPSTLSQLADLKFFNRLSIGIQSFNNSDLRMLNRHHTGDQAISAVLAAHQAGFRNISIDLMYGLPDETPERWQQDLDKALSLHVPHISAYHLSYEEGTPLWQMRQRGEVREADENDSVAYFRMLRRALLDAGYIHYEISNFALPGHQAIHNSSYWSGEPYLGIGPGAHSYDGTNRCWNKPDLLGYLKGDSIIEEETLTDDERYDEYIMTRLRTARGIDFDEIARLFGEEKKRYCSRRAQPHIKSHRLHVTPDGRLALTEEGIFVSDGIIADLFSE